MLPVVEKIASELDVVISVDTSTPEVITESAKLGAGLINDVRALGREGAIEAAAAKQIACLFDAYAGKPSDNAGCSLEYDDVLDDVEDFLLQRVKACESSGYYER